MTSWKKPEKQWLRVNPSKQIAEKYMAEQTIEKPDYGNWVSKKLIYLPGLIGLVFLGLALLSPWWLLPAIPFVAISAYFAYARYLFSPQGGDVQKQIRDLVLANLAWDGKGQALDVGCGNGALVIALAQKHPAAHITGIDFWGGNWEYSKNVCERNAQLEGAAERCTFQKASAAELPFADETFDAAVSNLTFHEVNGTADKRGLVREALRVVRKGGIFAFQDLFLIKPAYGDIEDLVKTIQGWGIEKVAFIETRNSAFIPKALKLPFMVGTLGLIVGKK